MTLELLADNLSPQDLLLLSRVSESRKERTQFLHDIIDCICGRKTILLHSNELQRYLAGIKQSFTNPTTTTTNNDDNDTSTDTTKDEKQDTDNMYSTQYHRYILTRLIDAYTSFFTIVAGRSGVSNEGVLAWLRGEGMTEEVGEDVVACVAVRAAHIRERFKEKASALFPASLKDFDWSVKVSAMRVSE